MHKRVLISGGSVAGPALAHWLHRYGYAPTVVERAPTIRAGGAAVDFRGSAIDVLDRMGLLAEMRAHETRMGPMTIVDDAGETVATLPTDAISGELEVLKSDVTDILYAATRDHVEYLFDNTITSLAQTTDGVDVELEHGDPRSFDLVIGADGLHSTVRRLAFGPESRYIRNLNIWGALFSTDNFLGLRRSGLIHSAAGRNTLVFSAHDDAEMRVGLSFRAELTGYDRFDIDRQKSLVGDAFAGAGWEIPRLVEAMNTAPDFYFDSSSQIEIDRWSAGRVALLGDAGYCSAPTSGRGTSQALIGAYLLAGELAAAGDDHRAAFAGYERAMRGYVERNQELGRAGARWFFQPPTGESVEAISAPDDGAGDDLPLPNYRI